MFRLFSWPSFFQDRDANYSSTLDGRVYPLGDLDGEDSGVGVNRNLSGRRPG